MHIDKENNSIFLIQKLNNIKQTLNSDPINLSNLKREFESFEKFKQEENYNYLEDLLDPINRKGVKMPSKMPCPTCSFQLHNEYSVYVNNRGYTATIVNPFFLTSIQPQDRIPYKNGGSPSTKEIKEIEFIKPPNQAWALDDSNFDGTRPGIESNTDPAFNMQFSIPPIYTFYRVVSACAQLYYTGNVTEAQGLVGGAISTEKFLGIAAEVRYVYEDDTTTRYLSKPPENIYDAFMLSRIRQNVYSAENNALDGIKMLYFPLDNSFAEFKPVISRNNVQCKKGYLVGDARPIIVGPEQTGFNWTFYVTGGPLNARNVYKFEYWINYECIPDSKFLNYIPVSINVWKLPKWKISELAKTMEKHAVTAIKKMNGINFFIA